MHPTTIRRALLVGAALAGLSLTGCDQPPGDAPSFEPLQLDLPEPAADADAPLLPAAPDGPAEAPEPVFPDEVTAYCHGGSIVDYKPKTAGARQEAQDICADQQTYDEFGFTEPDPR